MMGLDDVHEADRGCGDVSTCDSTDPGLGRAALGTWHHGGNPVCGESQRSAQAAPVSCLF